MKRNWDVITPASVAGVIGTFFIPVGEDKEAYDAWVKAGGEDYPPVDCAVD